MNFRSETVGIDPDKDYLLDPQQIPVYPGRCDCCGYSIQRGDRFYQLPLCTGLVFSVHKSELTVCQDCKRVMDSSEAEWEGIKYGD